jgi:hypothetical protein
MNNEILILCSKLMDGYTYTLYALKEGGGGRRISEVE